MKLESGDTIGAPARCGFSAVCRCEIDKENIE